MKSDVQRVKEQIARIKWQPMKAKDYENVKEIVARWANGRGDEVETLTCINTMLTELTVARSIALLALPYVHSMATVDPECAEVKELMTRFLDYPADRPKPKIA